MLVVTGLKMPHFLNKILGNISKFLPFSFTNTADYAFAHDFSLAFVLVVCSLSENSDFLLIFTIIIL